MQEQLSPWGMHESLQLHSRTAAAPRAPQPLACAEPRLSPRGFRPRPRQPGGGGWAGETIICSCSMGSHIPGFSVPGEPSTRRHGDFTDPLPLPLLPHLVPFNGLRRPSACAPALPCCLNVLFYIRRPTRGEGRKRLCRSGVHGHPRREEADGSPCGADCNRGSCLNSTCAIRRCLYSCCMRLCRLCRLRRLASLSRLRRHGQMHRHGRLCRHGRRHRHGRMRRLCHLHAGLQQLWALRRRRCQRPARARARISWRCPVVLCADPLIFQPPAEGHVVNVLLDLARLCIQLVVAAPVVEHVVEMRRGQTIGTLVAGSL